VVIIAVIFEYYPSVIFCLISNFVSVIDFRNIKHKKETLAALLASCEKEPTKCLCMFTKCISATMSVFRTSIFFNAYFFHDTN
jgi:hypothetical protein